MQRRKFLFSGLAAAAAATVKQQNPGVRAGQPSESRERH